MYVSQPLRSGGSEKPIRSLNDVDLLSFGSAQLFVVAEVPTGPTELSQVQRDKRKLGTICHALIAEHMFTPNLDRYTGDYAIIDTFTREDSVRATRSNSRGTR